MNNEKGRFFTITDNKGVVKEYEILFTFDSEETKKSYIVFIDSGSEGKEEVPTYAATYSKNDDKLELKDIETEKEWDLIENLLAQIEDKVNE